jgi:hypothetical protein
MPNITCEFCKSIVSSKYILKTHLATNKTCLGLRNLELKTEFMCKACNLFTLDNQKLATHHEICKPYQRLIIKEETTEKYQQELKDLENKYQKEMTEMEHQYENKILLLENKLEHVNQSKTTKEIDMKYNYEKIIKDLQSQNDKLLETLQKLASQAIDKPTTNTTNNVTNNIKNNFSDTYFLDTIKAEDVKMKCQNYLTEQVFLEGQRGIAQLCTDHVIKTKDKKALMLCTDVSRKKFKYIDEQGNIKEDYEARTFVQKVSKPIKDASRIVYDSILFDVKSEKETLEDDDYSRKAYLNSKELKTIDCYVQITHFDDPDNNQEFKNELAILNK